VKLKAEVENFKIGLETFRQRLSVIESDTYTYTKLNSNTQY
jgi:hypothetical protein